MNEKIVYAEHIDDINGKKMYYKNQGIEARYFRFWIPVVSKWFTPCEADQKVLEEIFIEAVRSGSIKIDDETKNIELKVSTDILDDKWKTIEKREATAKEIEELDEYRD